MAVTITPLGLTGTHRLIRDADVDATLEANVNDGAATLYGLDIDNSANAAASYVKVYNATTATVGTTDPDLIIMVPASVRRSITIPAGLKLATGLSFAAVTAGGTAGTTAPTSNVVMNLAVA